MSDSSLPPQVEDDGQVVVLPTPTDVLPPGEDSDSTDAPIPDTPSAGETATLGEEENVGEEVDETVEEEKEQEKEEEKENEKQKEKEARKDKAEGEWAKDVTRKAHKQPVSNATGLVSWLVLLVACLTGILTLRP